MPNHNNTKKKNRVRQRDEIGVQGTQAVAAYDREQAAEAEYQAVRARHAANAPANHAELPATIQEVRRNFRRMDRPDAFGNYMLHRCPESHEWKIIIAKEDLFTTFLGVVLQLKKSNPETTFDQFKRYMKSKYYVNDDLLDCFIQSLNHNDKNNEASSSQNGETHET